MADIKFRDTAHRDFFLENMRSQIWSDSNKAINLSSYSFYARLM